MVVEDKQYVQAAGGEQQGTCVGSKGTAKGLSACRRHSLQPMTSSCWPRNIHRDGKAR